MTMIRWWVSESSSSAPRRWSRRCLSSIDESGPRGRTRRATSAGANPPSMSIETSSARVLRRYWSIAALRAISKIHGLKAIAASVWRSRLQRRHERLLRHVLRAAAVPEVAAHERRDARVVAPVQLLEGSVVPVPHGGHQINVRGHYGVHCRDPCGAHLLTTSHRSVSPTAGRMYPVRGAFENPPRRVPRAGVLSRDGRARRPDRLPRRAAGARSPSTTTGRTASRCRDAEEVERVVTGVSAQPGAVRAGGGGGRAARALPPRALLGLPPARDHPADEAPAGRCCSSTTSSLAAYHLPLDAHPEVGNNALICEAPGARARRAVRDGPRAGRRDGWGAARPGSRSPSCASAAGAHLRAGAARLGLAGPDVVHSLGVVSGAAASSLAEAIALGLDAFSRASRRSTRWPTPARPASTSSPAATTPPRRSACAAWASCSRERFGVVHRFIDIPNPI